MTITIVEWPRANQNPTDTGRLPSASSLRVVLSIAAMWSASNACRIPSVNAVTPRPTPKTWVPNCRCCGATTPSSTVQAMRFMARTTARTLATARHSARPRRADDTDGSDMRFLFQHLVDRSYAVAGLLADGCLRRIAPGPVIRLPRRDDVQWLPR